MHLVHFPTAIILGQQGVFPAGDFYLEDVNAAELMIAFPNVGLRAVHFEQPQMTRVWHDDATVDLKILIAGGLGYGDGIMLTPVLRELKKKYPCSVIHIACLPTFRPVFLNLPYVDGFAEWPLPKEEYANYDQVHFLERFCDHPKAKTHHLTEVFADIVGIEVWEEACDYLPTDGEVEWAVKEFPRVMNLLTKKPVKRIGIQVQASQRCRTYPTQSLRDVMNLLLKKGWEMYMMGRPGEFGCQEIAHIHDLSKYAPTFRQSAAFLKTCDAFLGPDSGFLHAAGAMEVPSVGLYGPFPWQFRTSQYPSVFSLQGVGECSPCFHSPTKLQPAFPMNGPCAKAGHCTVLETITPERIVAKLEELTSGPA